MEISKLKDSFKLQCVHRCLSFKCSCIVDCGLRRIIYAALIMDTDSLYLYCECGFCILCIVYDVRLGWREYLRVEDHHLS